MQVCRQDSLRIGIMKKIPTKIKKGYHFLFIKTNEIKIHTNKSLKINRIIDGQNKIESPNIILSTYFTSKLDPQRDCFQDLNNFEYIKNFYNSIVANKLNAIIFYDNLSQFFVDKYNNENIKFIKVKLGNYSLNDERFFIYAEYIQKYKPEKIIMCDVNDVVVQKHTVFDFIKSNKLYVGRDENNFIANSNWILNKIAILPTNLKKQISLKFQLMPFINAGVIGGDYNTIISFLNKLNSLLNYIDNDLNNNMVCVNLTFFDIYWREIINPLGFRIRYLLNRKNLFFQYENEQISRTKFHIGAPFTSSFKKYESPSSTDYYIYHK